MIFFIFLSSFISGIYVGIKYNDMDRKRLKQQIAEYKAEISMLYREMHTYKHMGGDK